MPSRREETDPDAAPRRGRVSTWRARRARQVLSGGGLIAYPTEAVWGLGCDPWNRAAVGRLIELKGRHAAQGIILVAAELGQVDSLVEWPGGERGERVKESWPGFVTWILRARPAVPDLISGGRATVAVRISAHPVVRELCLAFGGPLVSTSANPHGSRPARSALAVRRYFPAGLDLIVHGRLGGEVRPSPIRDAATGAYLRV